MALLWNGSDSTAHISLSNTDHTATAGSGSGNEGIRGTISKSSGKWYLEYSALTNLGGSGRIGFANGTDTLGGAGQFGIDPGGTFHIPSGGSFADFGSTYVGKVVDFAVDLTNNLVWARYDGGNWNGNGSADPATGTGGHDITGWTGSIFPYTWMQFNPGTATLNGGDSSFTYAAPSGFTAWGGTPSPTGTWASTDPQDTAVFTGYPGTFGLYGQLASTEATDIFAADGYTSNLGTLVGLEQQDSFLAYVFQPIEGSLAATEAKDIFVAAGVGLGRNGTWASTEAADIFAALGVAPVRGPLIATDTQDRFQAIGQGVTQVRPRRMFFVT